MRVLAIVAPALSTVARTTRSTDALGEAGSPRTTAKPEPFSVLIATAPGSAIRKGELEGRLEARLPVFDRIGFFLAICSWAT